MKAKPLLINFILLFAVLAIAFTIAELGMRFYLNKATQREFDVNNYEFNYTVKINSDNFRDEEFVKEKQANTFRIFLIGDSFTYGSGTKQNATIDRLLEKRLNKDSLTNHEVYNLGVYGGSPVVYYKIAKKFGNYAPDLVIVSLYVDNDIQGRFASFKKWLSSTFTIVNMVNTNLQKIGASEDCLYPWVKKYYIEDEFKEMACKGLINPFLLKRAEVGDNQEYYNKLKHIFVNDPTTKDKILMIKRIYPEAHFLLLIQPSKYQVSTEHFPELRKLGFVLGNTTVDRELQDAIIDWAEKNNINYLDILPVAKASNETLYYMIDGHYNSRGNSLVADKLYEKIIEIRSSSEKIKSFLPHIGSLY